MSKIQMDDLRRYFRNGSADGNSLPQSFKIDRVIEDLKAFGIENDHDLAVLAEVVRKGMSGEKLTKEELNGFTATRRTYEGDDSRHSLGESTVHDILSRYSEAILGMQAPGKGDDDGLKMTSSARSYFKSDFEDS